MTFFIACFARCKREHVIKNQKACLRVFPKFTHLITFTPAHFFPPPDSKHSCCLTACCVGLYSLLHNTTMASSVFTRNLLPKFRGHPGLWPTTLSNILSSMPAYAQQTKKDHEDHHQCMMLSCYQIIKLGGKEVAAFHYTAFQPRQWERETETEQPRAKGWSHMSMTLVLTKPQSLSFLICQLPTTLTYINLPCGSQND